VYEVFDTADDDQIFIGITSDQHWKRFCEAFARPDLLADPKLKTNEDRVRARKWLIPVCKDIVQRRTKAELAEICDRISIPYAPVARTRDLFDDPQLNAGGRMLPVRMPDGTMTKLPRLPVEIGDHDLGLRRQPPAVGEHTREVLRELGLDDTALAELEAKGIIVTQQAAAAEGNRI
jgi:crotonobetainyl-CoA:carnitine CoA-transferase CaiB-like acyl-CoA transferase